jgi:GTPase SAR1 family protein
LEGYNADDGILHSQAPNMNDVNIAVIGGAGVGKSTLIQKALSLRSLPTGVISSLKMTTDNTLYTVSLIELDLESFQINPERRIHWPKQINGQIVPKLHGALILYDVMNRDSIADLPQTLHALCNSDLPSILVSCKCDNPPSSRQIDTDSMEKACLACVEALKVASNVPGSARNCLSAMVHAVMASRTGEFSPATLLAAACFGFYFSADPSLGRGRYLSIGLWPCKETFALFVYTSLLSWAVHLGRACKKPLHRVSASANQLQGGTMIRRDVGELHPQRTWRPR